MSQFSELGVLLAGEELVEHHWLDEQTTDPEEQRLYAQESCILSATETIVEAMERTGLTRRELAERLGKSPAFVSKTLNGPGNLTLRTVGDFLWACGVEVQGLSVAPLGVVEVPASHPVVSTVVASATTLGTSLVGAGNAGLPGVSHGKKMVLPGEAKMGAGTEASRRAPLAATNNLALAA